MQRFYLSSVALVVLSLLCAPLLNAQTCLPPVSLPAITQPNIFTDEGEVHLGDAVAERIQKNYKVIEDTAVTDYLVNIGNKLAKHLPLTKLRFQFFLVDLPDANAFVLPGGRIYISRKLVALAESEDEVAGVIAHEMGHLVAHEQAINVTRQFREVLGVTAVADRRDIFEKYNQLIENVARKPDAFKRRDREAGQVVADQVGFYALLMAGYDPEALARFWDRMTEVKGRTGGFFSDLFGTTKPEERRLREMLKGIRSLPPECLRKPTAEQIDIFKDWQGEVVSYTGLGRRESLHGVLSKLQLSPPLRSDIVHIRFSPDGQYVIAQDDAGITVLTREPFAQLFRIEAPEAKNAMFSPDSSSIVFATDNLRVEKWSIEEQKLLEANEVVILRGCIQTSVSSDGKYLACLKTNFDLAVVEVANGQPVVQRKEFFKPTWIQGWILYAALAVRRFQNGDAGLSMVNMGFSPDAHYFLAGFLGPDNISSVRTLKYVEGFDLTLRKKFEVPDSIERFVIGGFSFLGNDRMVGVNSEDYKKSGLVTFPGGQVLSEFALRGRLEGATKGEYVLVRPVKDYPVGVFDLNTKIIFKSNKQPALDIYGDVFVAERRNGELGLYKVEKSELLAATLLSNFSLGRLFATALSPDSKWIAISGRSRGGVWNLEKGEAALYLRGFRGAHLSNDGYFFADFPKYETAERNIARFRLATGEVAPGPTIDAYGARQFGQYLFVTKPAKEGANEKVASSYSKNVIVEVSDARTTTSLWKRSYPKEAPRTWASPQHGTVSHVWDITDEAVKLEIKDDAQLTQQLASMKEKEGDYFVEVLDIQNGKPVGRLFIETGKGSFRLQNIYATADCVIATDSTNRVLIYSLKTGQLLGRAFGGFAAVSPTAGLLCVENETGKLAVYDLAKMEKRDEFVFSSPIALLRFSDDGKRLVVITSNQYVYTIDVGQFARSNTTATSGVNNN